MEPMSWWQRLQRTFLSGFFIIAPFSLSLLLLASLVTLVDRSLAFIIPFNGKPIPGLGLALALLIIFAAGIVANNFAGRRILSFFEEFLLRIPVFNWLYRTIKQISEIFSPSNKMGARGVVLIEYPKIGDYSLGFITKELSLKTEQGGQELLAVYVPTNNIYIGTTVLTPSAQVQRLAITAQEGIQAILSGGASLPHLLHVSRAPIKSEPPA